MRTNRIVRWGMRALEGTSYYRRAVQQLVFRNMIEENMFKWVAKPIYVVTRLGIPELLRDGPKTVVHLALQTDTNAHALRRVMDALTGVGVFRNAGGGYELDHLGKLLTSDRLRAQVLLMQSEWHDRAWSNLLHSVKTGEPAFKQAFGTSTFDWFSRNPEAATEDTASHAARLCVNYEAQARACNYGAYRRIVDVGGGRGELLVQILKAHPGVRGVLADLPYVVEVGKQRITAGGFGDRCECIPCDFFELVPSGGDLYVLHQILHDWKDPDCLRILRSCRAAMGAEARLLAIDLVVRTGAGLSKARLLDLEMLVMGSGCERTEAEFRALFAAADLEVVRLVSFKSEMSVFELRQLWH